MKVAILTASGSYRVLGASVGQTFPIVHFTDEADPLTGCCIADFRRPGNHVPFQPWSLSLGDYALVSINYDKMTGGWSATPPIRPGKFQS